MDNESIFYKWWLIGEILINQVQTLGNIVIKTNYQYTELRVLILIWRLIEKYWKIGVNGVNFLTLFFIIIENEKFEWN